LEAPDKKSFAQKFTCNSTSCGVVTRSAAGRWVGNHRADHCNSQMAPKMIRKDCAISEEGEKLLEKAVTRLGLSASERGNTVPDAGPGLLGVGRAERFGAKREALRQDGGIDAQTGY